MTLSQPAFDTLKNQILYTDLLTLCGALPSQSVDMILCDLPYGTTACSWDSIIPLEPMWEQFKRVIKPRGAIVLTASQPFTSKLVMSNIDWFKYEWVWIKEQGKQPQLANIRPQKAHESVLIFASFGPNYNPQFWVDVPYNKKAAITKQSKTHAPGFYGLAKSNQEARYPISYLYSSSETGLHPTQKPVALFEYLIRTYTQAGELVLDPCIGSGTTAIAARQTGRHFIGGDITLEYVNIARARLAKPYTPPLFLDEAV